MKIETKGELGDIAETTCFERPIKGYAMGMAMFEGCDSVDVLVRHLLPDGKVDRTWISEKYLQLRPRAKETIPAPA